MPKFESHQKIAEKNQAVIDLLLPHVSLHPEWVVTVAFCRAVHLIEGLFARESSPFHSVNHEERLNRLKRDRRYENIFKHFRPLFTASLIARSMEADGAEHPLFTAHMSSARVQSDILNHRLRQVEAGAQRMFASLSKPE